ncbi:MAG: hypothetical protein RMY34_06460 [Aulosira sp. DedQUE10]|nr:hypothetical protein [Aulosira sp. DedQUE10]
MRSHSAMSNSAIAFKNRHLQKLIMRCPKALVGANGRTPKRRSKLRPYVIFTPMSNVELKVRSHSTM